MSNKNIKDAIDSRLCGVRYDPQKALQAAYRAKKPTLKVIPFKRIISVAAACCVMLTCSVAALASPSLSGLVSLLGQNIMDMVQPVVQQCDSSDVRMEVLAAMNDDDAVVIYMTLQDLKGKRIDAETELYDIAIDGIVFPRTEVIHYDEASRTATLRVTGTGGEKLDGQKITLSLNTILTGASQQLNIDTGYTAADIAANSNARALHYPNDISEVSGNEYYDTMHTQINNKNYPVLMPEQSIFRIPSAPWTYLSGYGIVNNTLRLQQNPDDDMGRYNTLYFSFSDESGEALSALPSGCVSFGKVIEADEWHRYADYKEEVFALPEGTDLSKLHLLANTRTYAEKIVGEWETSFVLQSVTAEKTASCIINMNPWEITSVSVSPIGVTVKGHGQMFDYSESPNVTARRLDGTEIAFVSSSCTVNYEGDTEAITIKNAFAIPIEVSEVASVRINGVDIAIK